MASNTWYRSPRIVVDDVIDLLKSDILLSCIADWSGWGAHLVPDQTTTDRLGKRTGCGAVSWVSFT